MVAVCYFEMLVFAEKPRAKRQHETYSLFRAHNKFISSVHVVIQINPIHNSTTSASKTRSIVSYHMLSQ